MYCNKVKKGKHCIAYMLQLNLTKSNLHRSLSVRLAVWLFHSFHECALPHSELGCADQMTHCGMVPNGVVDLIEFQLMSLFRIEVLACSVDTNFNYGLF